MAKYRFIRNNNKIICLSSYAKKVVRGIAKCSPNDDFSVEIGERLAQLRCDFKVAEKRMNRAYGKYLEARKALLEAREHFDNMNKYYDESCWKYNETQRVLYNFQRNI